MTLGELFAKLSEDPSLIIFYFVALPLTAFLAYVFGKGEGNVSPWKYLYSTLTYLAVIPGVFSITLNIYLFLFERMSIMESNIYTQILPILTMVLTLILIRRNICFEDIPGFGRLSALIALIVAILSFMWLIDRTRIYAITFVPFHYIIIFFLVFLVVMRFATKRMFTGNAN